MSKQVSVKVIDHFFDKEEGVSRQPNDVISVSEARSKEIIAAKVGEISDVPVEPVKEKEKPKESRPVRDMLTKEGK